MQKGITSYYKDSACLGEQNYSLDALDTVFGPCVSCAGQGSLPLLFAKQSLLNLSSPSLFWNFGPVFFSTVFQQRQSAEGVRHQPCSPSSPFLRRCSSSSEQEGSRAAVWGKGLR